MSGHDSRVWLDYKYNGDIEDTYYKEIYTKRLEEEEEYDNSLDKEWNNLYNY